ncbi:MAG: tRNA (adenosine(37)-N6)-dimethylallyltransferase MiaA [Pseudomonadales bacterium]
MVERPLILALVGPTGVGKTDVACELAERFPVSLISLDSAQVYRQMDIGTAKPDLALRERHPHALIDIRDPAEPYSAADFLRDADAAILAALAADRIPLLVGGTMLYLKAFRDGLAPMPSADVALRARLAEQGRSLGRLAMFERLKAVDPQAAANIHPNNVTRVQRALEVYELTGKPMTSFWSEGEGVTARLGARLLEFAIEPDSRQALHERIEVRFAAMLEAGFVDEVARLRGRGDLHLDLPSMRAVGYRQIWDYLAGTIDAPEMHERALAATRQLAKRQFTWLRGWTGIESLRWGQPAVIAQQIGQRAHLAKP